MLRGQVIEGSYLAHPSIASANPAVARDMAINAALYAAHLLRSYEVGRVSQHIGLPAVGHRVGHTSSYDCRLAFRSPRVIILSGPLGPKFMADALVVSENVGEGGPGDVGRFDEIARERNERARGML